MRYDDLNLDNKNILITGGAGFIGSNLAYYFQKYHPNANVVVFDLFDSGGFGHFKNLINFQGEVISGDINSLEDILNLKSFSFDYIFHQAAISDTTMLDQALMIKTNVNAFKTFLELAKDIDATLVYASSGAVYGNSLSPQKVGVESPNNVYGFSKLMMDNLSFKYLKQYPQMKIVGLRYFNVYGKGEYFKEKTASMVLQLGLQILNNKAPRLFYNSDKILRDFVYIEDAIQANILALSAKKSGVYNVGSSVARSFQDIADILQKELNTDLGTDYFKNPYHAYQTHTLADIKDTIEFLNYKPNFSLESGIKDYIDEIKRIALYE